MLLDVAPQVLGKKHFHADLLSPSPPGTLLISGCPSRNVHADTIQ
jgi:hypothetical protein